MVITTAGTSEKSGTLAKRKPRHCIFMHSCLRFSPFGGRTTGIIARKWRLIDLNYWLYFYCGFIYWAKVAQKTAFRADSLWEMGQRCSIKGSVSQERTSDATRCNWRYNTLHLLARTRSISPYNTLQCEIQRDVCPFWTLYRILFAGSWFSIPLTRTLVAFSAAKNRQPNHINMRKMWINIQDYSHAT